MTVVLNGKASSTKTEGVIAVNGRRAVLSLPAVNGDAPTNITINGYDRPPVLAGCVFHLPLWHSKLSRQGLVHSMDRYCYAGTVTGALWRLTGRYFDNLDDVIDFGQHVPLSPTEGIALEAWVYPQSNVGTDYIFSNRLSYSFGLIVNGRLYHQIKVDGGWRGLVSDVDAFSIGEWMHVVFAYSSTAHHQRIYVNGSLVKEEELTGLGTYTLYSTTGAQVVGAYRAGEDHFHGGIGELRLYDREPTAPEILRSYLATKWRYQQC